MDIDTDVGAVEVDLSLLLYAADCQCVLTGVLDLESDVLGMKF